MAPRTLYQKIRDAHVVHEEPRKPALIMNIPDGSLLATSDLSFQRPDSC